MGGHRLEWPASRGPCPVRTSNRAPCRGHWISQPIELALGERAAVVGADVVDGVEAAVDVEDGDRPGRRPRPASCRRGEARRGWPPSRIRPSVARLSSRAQVEDRRWTSRRVRAWLWRSPARVTSALSRRRTPLQPADPEHAQDLGQADPLDQVVGDLEDLLDRGAARAPRRGARRTRGPSGPRSGRRRGATTRLAVELDEQVDRRLALLDPVRGVLVGGQPIGQGRQALGEVDQELDPLLAVGLAQLGDDRRRVRRAWNAGPRRIKRRRLEPRRFDVQAPLAIGARTRLPHSRQEPS